MTRSMICALPLVLLPGCASPFDERGDAVLKQDELPRWVLDEWEANAPGHPKTARSRHDDDREVHSLDELIDHAVENHPSVQAAAARWHAARHRIVQAGTLPEPELTYRIGVEQIDTDQSPIGHTVGISQMFPWFGTLERAMEVRSAEARAAAQRYVQQQLRVVGAIKTAWAEYVYLARAAEVFREQIALLNQLEPTVRANVRTGGAGQRDLVRIEAEIDRVENDLRDAQEMIVAAAAQVNAAAGRRATAPLLSGDDASRLENSPGQRVTDDTVALLGLLARMNPELERLRHELAARRHEKQLAEKQYYPDIMLGVEYGIDTSRRMARMMGGGSDMLMGMIGLRLPLWRDSYEAGVREAMAEWGATLRELDDRQNTLEAELKMTIYAMRDAQRRKELFGDRLRIRAEQVLQSTRAAYRAGEATFTDLIEAQRELLEFELATHRAEADRFKAIATLEEIVGRAFDTVEPVDTYHQSQERTR